MAPSDELTLAAARLEALDAAATPGEWVQNGFEYDDQADTFTYDIGIAGSNMSLCYTDDKDDAAFIAAMRGVAKPLAAWLRDEVRLAALVGEFVPSALTLAREVIRATGGTP